MLHAPLMPGRVAVVDRSGCGAKRHGDAGAYSWWRCRCPDAREDWRLTSKRRREGRHIQQLVDSTGTANRIRALYARGYDWAALASHLRCSRRSTRGLGMQEHPKVTLTTAQTARALYRRLSCMPEPTGTAAIRARARGKRYGWWTPEQWAAWGDAIEYVKQGVADEPDDLEYALVRRVLYGQAPYSALRNDTERRELWLAWRRYREEFGLDGPGLTDFSKQFGVDRYAVTTLRDQAEDRVPAHRARKSPTTAVGHDCASERTAA